MVQRPVRSDLAQPPTLRELTTALGKLKTGKAGGSSNILPEMVKAACDDSEFRCLLLDPRPQCMGEAACSQGVG